MKPVLDTEVIDHLLASTLAHGLNTSSWRSRYFSHPAARVLIFGDRLRVFIPWGAQHA